MYRYGLFMGALALIVPFSGCPCASKDFVITEINKAEAGRQEDKDAADERMDDLEEAVGKKASLEDVRREVKDRLDQRFPSTPERDEDESEDEDDEGEEESGDGEPEDEYREEESTGETSRWRFGEEPAGSFGSLIDSFENDREEATLSAQDRFRRLEELAVTATHQEYREVDDVIRKLRRAYTWGKDGKKIHAISWQEASVLMEIWRLVPSKTGAEWLDFAGEYFFYRAEGFEQQQAEDLVMKSLFKRIGGDKEDIPPAQKRNYRNADALTVEDSPRRLYRQKTGKPLGLP